MAQNKLTAAISIPQGIEASMDSQSLTLKSSKGEIKKNIPSKELRLKKEGNNLILEISSKNRKIYAVMQSFEKQVGNMIKGLENSFEYKLAIVYSHFPINIAAKGNNVEINNFLGEKKPRIARIMPNVKVEIKNKEVFVKGNDKEAVGQTAANIEKATKVYGRDKRIFQDGIYLIEKGFEKEKGAK